MIYLSKFHLPSVDDEWEFLRYITFGRDSFYPFQFFPSKNLSELTFSDISIFCGDNGSGKTTVLNIIAEKLELERKTPFNKTEFFDPYISKCSYELWTDNLEKKRNLIKHSRIITSDDVFKHIISVRERNNNRSFKLGIILEEKSDMLLNGWRGPQGFNADDPESIMAYKDYFRKYDDTGKYIRQNVGVEERTYSNGENGFKYFTDAILPGGLYLLDEPENSLSTDMQLKFVQYIQAMARFYKCQFILSTHSPFFLSLPFARIYDMDENPIKTRKWTELNNIKIYYNFFKDHRYEFEKS